MKSGWNDDEIKSLLTLVENFKQKNIPLLNAFLEHSKKFNRNIYSVRNFYYEQVDKIKDSKDLQERLKVNLSLHEKNNFAKFDERQTKKLVDYINLKRKQGKSVRNACLELANNDAVLMVRYQNKYRSVMNKQLSNNKIKKTDEKFGKSKINSNNIISFPVENKLISERLTDDEIKSLFLGLVNLVKKSAIEEVNDSVKLAQQKNDIIFKKSLIEISKKDKKIDELLNENNLLTKKVLALKTKLESLRASTLENVEA